MKAWDKFLDHLDREDRPSIGLCKQAAIEIRQRLDDVEEVAAERMDRINDLEAQMDNDTSEFDI